MATDSILRTYGDVSAKEDVVLNAVEIITAKETQILNMLPKTTAINTIHSFLIDTLATAGSLAVGEGEDYTATPLTTPTRITNIVELIAKNYKVTRTQQNIAHYQGQDELARQTEKALMDFNQSIYIIRYRINKLRKLLENLNTNIYQSVKMVFVRQSAAKLCFH